MIPTQKWDLRSIFCHEVGCMCSANGTTHISELFRLTGFNRGVQWLGGLFERDGFWNRLAEGGTFWISTFDGAKHNFNATEITPNIEEIRAVTGSISPYNS